jgi:membrane protease YdiL (CAAX protease family)
MNTSSKINLSVSEIAQLVSTRALLGCGLGLLLANKMGNNRRQALGWTLFTIGALSTIPIALEIFGRGNVLQSQSQEKFPKLAVPA